MNARLVPNTPVRPNRPARRGMTAAWVGAAEHIWNTMGRDGQDAARVTTTLTRQQHAELEWLAERNSVKIAWLVRHAVERLIEDAQGGPILPFGNRPRGIHRA